MITVLHYTYVTCLVHYVLVHAHTPLKGVCMYVHMCVYVYMYVRTYVCMYVYTSPLLFACGSSA
jgi:hypothetical protein